MSVSCGVARIASCRKDWLRRSANAKGTLFETGRETPGMFEWDSAVAYYSGSRLDLPNNKGDFLFAFADERCTDFRTCGEKGKEAVGFAKSNHDAFKLFNRGQQELVDTNCRALRETKDTIEGLMTVPLVQGTIRYAHMVMGEEVSGRVEKHNGEASIFALSVLPIVHACNPLDAEIIHDHLKPRKAYDINFQAIKYALEKNYACMNIKCNEVGGIYDSSTQTFKPDAQPCSDLDVELTELTEGQKMWAVALGVTLLIGLALLVTFCVVKTCKRGEETSASNLQFAANSRAEIA
jgi:hypothetical protein